MDVILGFDYFNGSYNLFSVPRTCYSNYFVDLTSLGDKLLAKNS